MVVTGKWMRRGTNQEEVGILSSSLFFLSRLLSFSVFSFRHSGWLPLFSASENRVLNRDGLEVAVGGVDDEGGDAEEAIYLG